MWGIEIRDEWSGPPGPNGGYVAALILRAIRAEVGDPAREPRSLTIHYLRPPALGPAEVAVAVERSGRSASTCTARLRQNGKDMCIALCVLSADFEPAIEFDAPAPVVPAADTIEPMAVLAEQADGAADGAQRAVRWPALLGQLPRPARRGRRYGRRSLPEPARLVRVPAALDLEPGPVLRRPNALQRLPRGAVDGPGGTAGQGPLPGHWRRNPSAMARRLLLAVSGDGPDAAGDLPRGAVAGRRAGRATALRQRLETRREVAQLCRLLHDPVA
ncbi:thioesterase family protein, partial [uncultured Arthrobacter sp.]|uniref:thioesterase family protein n=1 Tax=uncultured Arthrobacter sp. TaxID=114050 RepID=UPI0032164F67